MKLTFTYPTLLFPLLVAAGAMASSHNDAAVVPAADATAFITRDLSQLGGGRTSTILTTPSNGPKASVSTPRLCPAVDLYILRC